MCLKSQLVNIARTRWFYYTYGVINTERTCLQGEITCPFAAPSMYYGISLSRVSRSQVPGCVWLCGCMDGWLNYTQRHLPVFTRLLETPAPSSLTPAHACAHTKLLLTPPLEQQIKTTETLLAHTEIPRCPCTILGFFIWYLGLRCLGSLSLQPDVGLLQGRT